MSRRAKRAPAPVSIAVIGNVAEDRAADAWVPGGPSLYSARTAAAMGARVTLVSNLGETYPPATLRQLDIKTPNSAPVPRFENTYDASGDRSQLLLAPGHRLPVAGIDGFDAVIVAPAFHELDDALTSGALATVHAGVLAFALQGFLRDIGAGRRVTQRPAPMETLGGGRIPPGALAFFSDEDTAEPTALARALAAEGVTALVTRGYRPVEVFRPGAEVSRYPVAPAQPADPTGAGDCFAAACVVRLAEGAPLDEAVRFALVAAALMVEGVGLDGIPTRDAVEARLAQVAA